MGRTARSWELAKASGRVLSAQRELFLVSIGTGLAGLLAMVAIISAGFAWVQPEQAIHERPQGRMWLVYGAGLVVGGWIASLGQGVIVAGTSERMSGGDASLASAWATARRRMRQLFAWTVLDTGVASVLDLIRERLPFAGRLTALLGHLAFTVAAFLVLPVIVLENTGAVEALRRSARLLRNTWGENLAFNVTLGAVGFVAITPALVFAAVAGAPGALPFSLVFAVAMGWIVLVHGVLSALTAVYKTVLYHWARDLPVPFEFAATDLEDAFRQRSSSRVGRR